MYNRIIKARGSQGLAGIFYEERVVWLIVWVSPQPFSLNRPFH
jgi:hypothetical protein